MVTFAVARRAGEATPKQRNLRCPEPVAMK